MSQNQLSTLSRADAYSSGWRNKLYIIIFESDTKAGKLFDLALLWAILLSVGCVILESDVDFRNQYGDLLTTFEWFFTALFSVEFILRLFSLKNKSKYVFSFFGIVDFVSVLPTYLMFFFPGTQYLMVVRILRTLRVFRILKLTRYVSEASQLFRAIKASREKIIVFLTAVTTLVLILGTLMHMVEGEQNGFSSILKGVYWAIVTMTTVGYGDLVPITPLGKTIASVIMVMGYGIIAVPTGIVTAELVQSTKDQSLKCPHCGKKFHS